MRVSFLSAVVLFAVSCGGANQTTQVTEVDPSGWFSPAEISFMVEDTLSVADMNVVLRYDNIIPVDSVELIVSTQTPDRVVWSDNLTIHISRGENSIHTLEIPYRHNIRWRQMGEYRLSLHPLHLYKGVLSAGVNVVYSE